MGGFSFVLVVVLYDIVAALPWLSLLLLSSRDRMFTLFGAPQVETFCESVTNLSGYVQFVLKELSRPSDTHRLFSYIIVCCVFAARQGRVWYFFVSPAVRGPHQGGYMI